MRRPKGVGVRVPSGVLHKRHCATFVDVDEHRATVGNYVPVAQSAEATFLKSVQVWIRIPPGIQHALVLELVDIMLSEGMAERCRSSSLLGGTDRQRRNVHISVYHFRYIKIKSKMWSRNYVSDEEIIVAIRECGTMSQACAVVKLKFSTFKRRAEKLNLYNPNQWREGIKRSKTEFEKQTYKLEDILAGKYPNYLGSRLRKRLIAEGIKQNCCEECGCREWRGKPLTCELHHVDGDPTNHKLKNLKMLCPNCHSQTDNFGRIRKA